MSGSQSVTNTRAFIEAEQYSNFILNTLHDGLLPEDFYRDVSDFGQGENLNIKTIGRTTLQEVTDEVPPVYNPIETGEVNLQITEFVGDGWAVKDTLREDGNQIDTLMAMRGQEATRAIQENWETRAFEVLNAAQVAGDENKVDGFAHRFVAQGTNQTLELKDLINMRLAFDKAQVPAGGRVAVVDPVTAASLETKFQGTFNVDSNPQLQEILSGGFSAEHRFVMNLFGWSILTSNRLPEVANETINGVSVTNGVANQFMSILDDQHVPLMAAWRRQPRVEPGRNKDLQQDEFFATARYGQGAQRVDTLGIILTSATNIE